MTGDRTGSVPGHGLSVGFDVGGTNLRGLPLRANGTIGESISMTRPDGPSDLVDAICDITERLGRAEGSPITAVGVGCAGIVDNEGLVRSSPNIPGLQNFPLRARVTAQIGLPVVVDNDATTAAWAEARLGAARGVDDMVFVAFGTGIGAGFVLGGALHRGASGFAGEVGHMTVAHDGIECVCGRRGCWERYASGTALARQAREAAAAGRADSLLRLADGAAEAVTSEHVAQLVAGGDADACAVLAEFAHWCAVGLANLVNILDPAMIVVGGGLSDIGDPLMDAIGRAYREVMVDHELRDPVAIVQSHFTSRSGAVGAAVLARDAPAAR